MKKIDIEKLEAVIFDYDGTLLDTEKLFYNCMRDVSYREYGIKLDKLDYIRNVSGTSTENSQNYFVKTYKVTDYPRFEKIVISELTARFDEAEILPGIIDTLKLLKKHNIKTAIASNGDRKHVLDGLVYKKLDKYFDAVVTREDSKNLKPAPDVYYKACEVLGVNIKNTIAVEDSYPGAMAASSSGSNLILQTNDITKYMDFSNVNYKVRDCDLFKVIKSVLEK